MQLVVECPVTFERHNLRVSSRLSRERRIPMRKIVIGFAFFVILGVAAYLRFHHSKPSMEVVYAGNRRVTLYSTTAQVREPVTTVSFGDRLDVLNRFQDEVEVKTEKGARGWVSERELLSSEIWEEARELTNKAAAMPVEARGHTRVLGNLHVDPGRDTPRVRQLAKDTPLDLLARKPVSVSPSHPSSEEETSAPASARKEDWWLVVARTPDQGTVAGWMLGRFIELDVPAPLPDYASSAGMRIVAWFELNRVQDLAGNPKVQYLVAGAKGPEGQACDFNLLRVYTWGVKHNRYETAFVDSNVCGKLPVEVAPAPSANLTFSFEDLANVTLEKRVYRMQQTIVRRVKQGDLAKPRLHAHR
jgi:hypothetical protein